MDLSRAHDVRVTLRQEQSVYDSYRLFSEDNSYFSIDVRHIERVAEVLSDFRPNVLINAVGVVKQRVAESDPMRKIEINALLPHRLAVICTGLRTRLIQLSTDCVFSGRRGNYSESDPPDPIDVYGHSKLLGEVGAPDCTTLRTSIIGRELSRKTSLLEWFLAQRGQVRGFKNAVFSGFTTMEMSRIMERLIIHFPAASGIYHVSSTPISKFDLLNLIKTKFELPVEVAPDQDFKCDRSLDSTRFRREFNYMPPTWERMIEELAADYQPGRQQ
jgi:dTDP-4-dehydrorhamnose reductase